RGGHGRERDDVVLHDHIGLELAEDLPEAGLGGARAAGQVLPDPGGGSLPPLDRPPSGLPRRVAGRGPSRMARGVLPPPPRHPPALGRRLQPNQRLLQALRLERARERFLDHEHDSLPALQEDAADSDAVVRRTERALREEDERAHERACSRSAQSSSGSSSPTLRRSRPVGTRSPSQRRRLSSSDSVPPRLVALVITRTDVSTLRGSATSNDSSPPKPG